MPVFVVGDGEPNAGGFEAGGGLRHELEAGVVVSFVAVADDGDFEGSAGVTLQVGGSDIEGLLRGSEAVTLGKTGGFVTLVAVGVKGVGPAVGGKMPEPAEADGVGPEAVEVFLQGLARGGEEGRAGRLRFLESIEITKRTAEGDFQADEFTGVVFGSVAFQPGDDALLEGWRNGPASRMGIEHPNFCRHGGRGFRV